MPISLDLLKSAARWAESLNEAECERARMGMSDRLYERHDYICHQGDRFNIWVGVLTGLVKVSTVSFQGKQVSLAGFADGAWFGEGSLLKNEVRRYDIVALRRTRLLQMDAVTFNWLQDNSFGFNRFLVRQMNDRLAQFIGQVENDRVSDATQRVARTLSSLFNPRFNPGIGNSVTISQEEIGLLSGLSRQVTNQALRKLEEDRLIAVQRGTIVVNDWRKLSAHPE